MPAPFLHVWHADLAAEYPAWGPAEAALSEAERARQARFRTGALRQTYGRAHGFLRAVLDIMLNWPPLKAAPVGPQPQFRVLCAGTPRKNRYLPTRT